ncbi:unnamed protein product [Bathycoccus prasinos]
MGKKRKLICSNCQAPFKKTTETISMIMSASIPSSFVAAAPPSSSPSSSSSVLCKACSRSRIGESVGGSLVPKTSTQSGGFVATMQTTTSNNNNNINNNRFAALASSALPNYRVEASLEDEEANNNDNGIKRSTKKKKKKKKKGGEQNKGNTNALKMNVMKDAECREILDELDEQVVFIDSYTSEAFTQCVLELKRAKVIAYDCEGVRLSRTGKITLLQIAIPKKIFLIDVMTIGGKEVFIDGGLKDIIESEEILKLAYDVRMDSDALFHQHDVVLKNVLDLQLLDIAIRRAAGGIVEHLPSLSKTVSRRLTNAEILVCEDLKKRVKNMYTSVEDGDLWARRPLIDDARRYAALDAWVLMKLDQAMRPNGTTAPHLFPGFDEKWNERVLNASRKRIDEYKDKEIPIEQGGKRTAEMTQAPPF